MLLDIYFLKIKTSSFENKKMFGFMAYNIIIMVF